MAGATKIKTAIDLVRNSGTVYIAPGDWQQFEQEWNKTKEIQE